MLTRFQMCDFECSLDPVHVFRDSTNHTFLDLVRHHEDVRQPCKYSSIKLQNTKSNF